MTEALFIQTYKNEFFSKYYQELFRARADYQRTETKPDIARNTPSEVIKIIQDKLPESWHLYRVELNTESNLYWFAALQPSYRYGSIRYIGYYRISNGQLSNLISYDEIWGEVVKKQGLSEQEKFSYVSLYLIKRSIYFSTNTPINYSVLLAEDKGRIIIQEITKK